MILGDSAVETGERTTLDALFRAAMARHPDAIALRDPPDRASFTHHAPRTLTWAEADRVVSGIAGRLRRLGLQTDTVVAMHLPNTVESILTMLGTLRAGMIAAPMPMLWRRADATAAVSQVGAKAIITANRFGELRDCEMAMEVAVDVFSMRFICAYGGQLPDGVIPLDDMFLPDVIAGPEIERPGNPAAHLAIVTWQQTSEGFMPVARSHAQCLAAGRAVAIEGHVAEDATLLSATPVCSLAGIASTLMPWLISGGTLVLHQPFNPDAFTQQLVDHSPSSVVLPGPLLPTLMEGGVLSASPVKSVLALWRQPERLASAPPFVLDAHLLDIAVFGETGLIPALRGADGKVAPLGWGIIAVRGETEDPIPVIEAGRSPRSTLALRGPMVSPHAFPPGSERGRPQRPNAAEDGFVDTGYPCRLERIAHRESLIVTGPQPATVGVGGYRFPARDIDEASAAVDGTLAAVPDALTGQPLAGSSPDTAAAATELTRRGLNPLLASAFRTRGAA